jgi:3-oxoacyl-[acyl-carrier protein] reductase
VDDEALRETSPAELVKLARRLARMSQAQLAAATGLPQSAVSAYEKGRRVPGVEQLRRVAAAAGYTLDLGLTRPDRGGVRLVGPLGAVLAERREEVVRVLQEIGYGRVWVVGDVARGEETEYQDVELVAQGADRPARGHWSALGALSVLLPRPAVVTGTAAWTGADGTLHVPADAVELTAVRLGQPVALVTGASRARGIGAAVVRRLVADGCAVLVHGWEPHDAEQPWGADEGGAATLVRELADQGRPVELVEADLADPGAPHELVAQAVARFGRLDVLVVNHARSSAGALAEVTAQELDLSFAVNARASVLLVRAFAEQVGPAGGRVVLFTSGQYHGGMPGELAYVASKGAVHQLTASLAVELAPRAVTVNCVDPGPTDTGWADERVLAAVRSASPSGRWGTPEDAARLVSWLAGPDSGWVTGQVIASDGGWSSR